MYQVGLTGGIAAGKSTVVQRLHRVHGLRVVDADHLARQVVAPGTDGLAQVVQAFGPEVVAADGTMNRQVVGEKIFNNPEARSMLEGIIHPRIQAARDRIIASASERVLIHDIPLLIETQMQDQFDEIVVVHCPAVIRVQRLINDRGMRAQEAWQRINAQISDDERLQAADTVIDNTKGIAELNAQTDALAKRLLQY
ncbi:dephospho-CoA kinase [Stomatohabitans albus]|uniref:dephospho-CoA kinase n=1 Tax=Stomatohabitans albus TaxID=3110766 RepID=UPI00300CECC7